MTVQGDGRGTRVTLRRPRLGGSRTCGFTLIEMSLVLVLLMVMAAFVAPSVASAIHSHQVMQLEGQIARLPAEARNEATTSQMPVDIRVDGDALVMERVSTDGTTAPEEVKRIELTSDIQVDSAETGGQSVDQSNWKWTVYPDGTSDNAGISFLEGNQRKSLVMPANGESTLITGDLPNLGQDPWTAGTLQARTMSTGSTP